MDRLGHTLKLYKKVHCEENFVFNSKIDKFLEFDNKISDLKTKKTEYLKVIQGLDKQISNTTDERLNYGIKHYLDKQKRQELLETAAKYGYSPEKLSQLQKYVEEWNQDVITNDVLDSFRMIEQFVYENQETYKGNIMYKFSKFLSNEGRNSNEN